jgi:hypothetical protein
MLEKVVNIKICRPFYYDRKKRYSRLIGRCAIIITTVTKKIQSSVWRVRDHYYDRKKNDTVVCLAGCAVVSVFGSGGKLAVFLLWRESFITTGKKNSVVCLEGARSLLQPKKEKIQLSFWWVRDHYYDRKKKDTVVCLVGCAVVSVFGSGGKLAVFFVVAGKFDYDRKKKIQLFVWQVGDHYYDRKKMIQSSVWWLRDHYYDRKKKDTVICLVGARSLLRLEKKRYSHLSGGCAIIITT